MYCGMCGDTGLQNGIKCPQPGCRKANGLPPFDAIPTEKKCCLKCTYFESIPSAGKKLVSFKRCVRPLFNKAPLQAQASGSLLITEGMETTFYCSEYQLHQLVKDITFPQTEAEINAILNRR